MSLTGTRVTLDVIINQFKPGAPAAQISDSFPANVNPGVPHPRRSQATERMLGSAEHRPRLLYNG